MARTATRKNGGVEAARSWVFCFMSLICACPQPIKFTLGIMPSNLLPGYFAYFITYTTKFVEIPSQMIKIWRYSHNSFRPRHLILPARVLPSWRHVGNSFCIPMGIILSINGMPNLLYTFFLINPKRYKSFRYLVL